MIQSTSALREEIASLLKDIHRDDQGIITARVLFPQGFSGFKGHFPGQPVVPGVCKIMLVCILLEIVSQRPVRLKQILRAKFSAPVTCGTELTVRVSSAETGRIKALIDEGTTKVAELHLEVSHG